MKHFEVSIGISTANEDGSPIADKETQRKEETLFAPYVQIGINDDGVPVGTEILTPDQALSLGLALVRASEAVVVDLSNYMFMIDALQLSLQGAEDVLLSIHGRRDQYIQAMREREG